MYWNVNSFMNRYSIRHIPLTRWKGHVLVKNVYDGYDIIILFSIEIGKYNNSSLKTETNCVFNENKQKE